MAKDDLRRRIYDAVAAVLDGEYVIRQKWGLSEEHENAASAAADAAIDALTKETAKHG